MQIPCTFFVSQYSMYGSGRNLQKGFVFPVQKIIRRPVADPEGMLVEKENFWSYLCCRYSIFKLLGLRDNYDIYCRIFMLQ